MAIKKNRIEFLFFSTIIFLNLFGALLNESLNILGVPPIFTLVKTVLAFLLLFLIPLDRKNLNCFLALIIFGLLYLSTGLLQNRLIPSLYFLRIYVEPLIVMLWLFSYIKSDNYQVLYKKIYNIFLLFALIGIVTFFLLNYSSVLSIFMRDNRLITSNWYITYTNIIRSGLPIGDPNKTGLIEIGVLSLFLLNYKEIVKYISKKKIFILLTFTAINLFLTFSKSAIASFFLFFIILKLSSFKIKQILIFLGVIFILGFVAYLMIPENEILSLTRWINALSNLEDSSSIGHYESFVKGLNILNENWFFGDDNGVWGTKARLFSGERGNIESSILLLLIDLGFLGSLIYLYFILFLIFYSGRISKKSILFLFLISLPLLVLPFIQELEAMLILYSILAFVNFKKKSKKQDQFVFKNYV
jgi:hypothetical protein